jgi:hypothetical protein
VTVLEGKRHDARIAPRTHRRAITPVGSAGCFIRISVSAVDAQGEPLAPSGAARRRHLSVRLRARRDRPGPVSACLSDGAGGHGLHASRPALRRIGSRSRTASMRSAGFRISPVKPAARRQAPLPSVCDRIPAAAAANPLRQPPARRDLSGGMEDPGAPLRSATACIIWPRNHPVASPAKRGKSTSAGRGHQ